MKAYIAEEKLAPAAAEHVEQLALITARQKLPVGRLYRVAFCHDMTPEDYEATASLPWDMAATLYPSPHAQRR